MADLNYSSTVRTAVPTESVVSIFSINDFPSPQSNEIVLDAKEYILEGDISLGGNTLKLPTVGTAKITSRGNLNYTLSCDSAGCLFCDNNAAGGLVLEEITIDAPNCTLFDVEGNGTNPIILNNTVISRVNTVGTIKGCALCDFSGFQIQDWNQGLVIDGVTAVVFRHGTYFGGNNQTNGVMLTFQGIIGGLTIYDTLQITQGSNESVFDFKSAGIYGGVVCSGNVFNTLSGGSIFTSGSLTNTSQNFIFNTNVGLEDGYIDGTVFNNTAKNELYTNIDSTKETVTHSGYHRCLATKSGDQAVASGAGWVVVTFDQEEYDVGDLHDNVTNNTRLTVQKDGWYAITYHIKHDASDKASYETRVRKNGSTVLEGTCDINVGSKDSSNGTLDSTYPPIQLTATDYVELQFIHDKDISQSIKSENTYFSIRRVY